MIFYNRRTPLIAIVALSATAVLFCSGKRAAHATLLQTGSLNYWRLNEGFGNVANDTGPSGTVADNGTLRGTPAWVNGIFNAGLEFSGVAPAQDVLIANSADMNIGGANAVTLSTWVKLGVLPGAAMPNNFASIFDATNDGYVMYLDKTNQELRFKTTDNNGVSTVRRLQGLRTLETLATIEFCVDDSDGLADQRCLADKDNQPFIRKMMTCSLLSTE